MKIAIKFLGDSSPIYRVLFLFAYVQILFVLPLKAELEHLVPIDPFDPAQQMVVDLLDVGKDSNALLWMIGESGSNTTEVNAPPEYAVVVRRKKRAGSTSYDPNTFILETAFLDIPITQRMMWGKIESQEFYKKNVKVTRRR